MLYGFLAGVVVLLHLAFVLFVVLGGLLALRWKRIVWVHLPAFIWGALIEFTGWICPLTPLEKAWRDKAGLAGYEGGFIERYIVPVVYPDGLTRSMQIGLGVFVLVLNLVVYALLIRRHWTPGPAKH